VYVNTCTRCFNPGSHALSVWIYMYVCMYVCMFVCMCVCKYSPTLTESSYACTDVCVCTYVCILFVCVCVCQRALRNGLELWREQVLCLYVHTCIYTYAHAWHTLCVCVCVCVCVYLYIRTYMHAYICKFHYNPCHICIQGGEDP